MFDKLEEIKIKFENIDSDASNPESDSTKKKFEKLLLKMLLKTGEEEKRIENAECLKLEEKFEDVDYDWNDSKKAFRKFKIDRESKGQINETNFMNRSSRSNERRSFHRGGNNKRYSRSRERRSSTPKFYQRHGSKSREHEGGSLKSDIKDINYKVENHRKKLDKIEKLLERIMSSDPSNMDSSVTGFITEVPKDSDNDNKIDNKIPSQVFFDNI